MCPVGSLKEYWERRQEKKKKKETFEEILAKNSNFLIYKINPHDEVVQ